VKLNNRLKEIRKQKNITQLALAKRVGVTRQTIIAVEQSKWEPSVKLALEIAAEMQCNINEIFWIESEGN